MTANTRHRGLPFLHRNWLKATNHWSKMGNKASSQAQKRSQSQTGDSATSRPATDGSGSQQQQNESQQEEERATKRRRISNDYDGFPLYENYASTQRALRIEVLKISHKDAPRWKNGITAMNGSRITAAPVDIRNIAQIKARCKLTIYGHRNGEQIVLHVDSQLCDIRVFKNSAGAAPMVRFANMRPFSIPEEKIFLEREDDSVFGLAKCYSVSVELESAGDPSWPPKELVPPTSDEETFYNKGLLPQRQWVLTANIADIYESRNRKSVRLRIKKHAQQDMATNFLMDMDVRWLTPISSLARAKEQAKDIQPSIVAIDPDNPIPLLVNGPAAANANGVNGQHAPKPECDTQPNGTHNEGTSAEEPAEGELTPSRSRRARQEINYNVKQLWNNAVGRETRNNSNKRRRGGAYGEDHPPSDDRSITYLLPPEQVHTDKFACLICGAENERLSQLRAHYMCHPQYDFYFEYKPKMGGYYVTVKPTAREGERDGEGLRPRVYQLGLPVKPLDLERYVEGDESWVTSRLGPENGREVMLPGRGVSSLPLPQLDVILLTMMLTPLIGTQKAPPPPQTPSPPSPQNHPTPLRPPL